MQPQAPGLVAQVADQARGPREPPAEGATVSSHESALTRSRRRIEPGAARITTKCPGTQLPPRPIQQLQLAVGVMGG